MIIYDDLEIHGVSEDKLPCKGFVQFIKREGYKDIYEFFPSKQGKWLYLWSGAIAIVEKGEILDNAYYYDRHAKFDDTIFVLEDGGIFDPLIDGTFYYQITERGQLKKVRVNP
jgi:hypothetical protein